MVQIRFAASFMVKRRLGQTQFTASFRSIQFHAHSSRLFIFLASDADFSRARIAQMAFFYGDYSRKRVGNFRKHQFNRRKIPHGNARAQLFRRFGSQFLRRHFKLCHRFHHRPQTRFYLFTRLICLNRNHFNCLDSRQPFNQYNYAHSSRRSDKNVAIGRLKIIESNLSDMEKAAKLF